MCVKAIITRSITEEHGQIQAIYSAHLRVIVTQSVALLTCNPLVPDSLPIRTLGFSKKNLALFRHYKIDQFAVKLEVYTLDI